MKQGISVLVAAACVLSGSIVLAGIAAPAAIEGNYLEARSCDVFTAACFANSEVGLTGEEAILAWDLKKGSYRGVDLAGLKIVAVIRASGTLGDANAVVYPARSILFVDSKADAAQSDALVCVAKENAGRLLEDVIRIEKVEIAMSFDSERAGFATLRAGDAVAIETRAILHSDMRCGNDTAYYGPLTDVDNSVIALTEHDMFSKQGLGVTWDDGGRRNAWLATFSN